MAKVNSESGTGAKLEIELPNQSANAEVKATERSDRQEASRTSQLNTALATLGLNDQEKLHAKAGLEAQSAGSDKLPSPKDIAAIVTAVTGRVDGLPSDVLASVTKIGQELKNGGTVGDHKSDYLVAGVQQKPQEQGVNV